MNIPNFASRCQVSESTALLSARIEPSWVASAAAPILVKNILRLCRIFGSLEEDNSDRRFLSQVRVWPVGTFPERPEASLADSNNKENLNPSRTGRPQIRQVSRKQFELHCVLLARRVR